MSLQLPPFPRHKIFVAVALRLLFFATTCTTAGRCSVLSYFLPIPIEPQYSAAFTTSCPLEDLLAIATFRKQHPLLRLSREVSSQRRQAEKGKSTDTSEMIRFLLYSKHYIDFHPFVACQRHSQARVSMGGGRECVITEALESYFVRIP